MYNVPHFKEKDESRILQFIKEHPFTLITGAGSDGKPVATQVPVLIEEKEGKIFLQGHILRKSDHHKAFQQQQDVLAIFTIPGSYVSASWYSQPFMGSTWNYMSVHIRGKIRILTKEELVVFMRKFTLAFEEGNYESPTFYNNLPQQYIDQMMPAIEGFEIQSEQIEHIFKLSQNRDETSYLNIINKLEEKGGDASAIAFEMKKRLKELFPLFESAENS
jgi:transcriptional regulator